MSAPTTPDELDLSGRWRAGRADEDLRRTWYGDDFEDSDGAFSEVDVPGHWRSTAAFATNDDPILYRRRFTTLTLAPHTRAWLHLDGICAQGDVWLDGTYLGNTDGAWIPHRFEVSEVLARRNEHVLGIEVASAPVGDRTSKRGLLGTWQDGPYVAEGWNPGGIWRPVGIRRTGPVAITKRRVLCTAATPTRAIVTVSCSLDAASACEVAIRTVIDGQTSERRQPLAGGSNDVTWSVEVPDPRLWWPAELGDQPMYDVQVEVSMVEAITEADAATTGRSERDVSGTVSDSFATRIGLREVRRNDWIWSINGERLFLRGVLVGPGAHELGTAAAEVFSEQIRHARDAGCNLVRVHAHLSRDELYDEADRTGMLVWQDLPLYRGQNRGVRRSALRTAQAAVDRLGSHPSIIVWCGHDDPDLTAPRAATVGFTRRFVSHELPNWSRSVVDRSVKRALSAADGTRPVIASSGTWPHPPSLEGSDIHLDLGWSSGAPEDLARLARAVPRAVRFVQITPSPSPTRRAPDDGGAPWPPENPAALIDPGSFDLDLLLARLPPDVFDSPSDWFRAAHNLQAHLIRTQVEMLRRLKYRPTGGFTIAHLADLYPTTAPSLVDHTGEAKPAMAALRDACAPLLVTLNPWPGCSHAGDLIGCDVHVVNDLRTDVTDARCDVRLRLTHTGSEIETQSWSFLGNVSADSVALVGRTVLHVPSGVDRVHADVRLTSAEGTTTASYTVPVHVHE